MSVVSLEAVYPCPKCGGTGRWHQPPCEHDWRLVQTMDGDGIHILTYACMNDGCEALLCSDCFADGSETCP